MVTASWRTLDERFDPGQFIYWTPAWFQSQ
jgi:hypothetical protein